MMNTQITFRFLILLPLIIGFSLTGFSQEPTDETQKWELRASYGISAYSASSDVTVTTTHSGQYPPFEGPQTHEYKLLFTTGGLEGGTSVLYRFNNFVSAGVDINGFLYMDRKKEGGLDFDWVDLNWTLQPKVSIYPFDFMRVNLSAGLSSFLTHRVLPGATKVDEYGYTQRYGVGARRMNFSSAFGIDFKVSDRIWLSPYAAFDVLHRPDEQVHLGDYHRYADYTITAWRFGFKISHQLLGWK